MKKSAPKPKKLTARESRFVEEFLVDSVGTQAAIRAGYSQKTAAAIASENLRKPHIAAAIASAQAKRSERTQIKQDDVLRHWAEAITADPNELIEYRVTCCRYCYGKDGRYQRTNREFDDAHKAWEAMQRNPGKDDKKGPFDASGGSGFDPRKSPNPDCMDCFGEGVGKVVIKDTRKLSPAARRLYAGVKMTRDGLEVKMHDPMGALEKTAQHLGMLVQRHKFDLDDLKSKSTEELKAMLEGRKT